MVITFLLRHNYRNLKTSISDNKKNSLIFMVLCSIAAAGCRNASAAAEKGREKKGSCLSAAPSGKLF